jgi:hypothetical protein
MVVITMSYEKEKKLLAQNILVLGKKVGINSISAIIRESRLTWKQIGTLDKGIGNPTFETLCKLAEGLQVDLSEIVKFDSKKKKK